MRNGRTRMSSTKQTTWKRCPVARCDEKIALDMLMCRTHWRRVPEAVRLELYTVHREAERFLALAKSERPPAVASRLIHAYNAAEAAAIRAAEEAK